MRAGVFSLLLAELKKSTGVSDPHPGFRLAPLPRNAVAAHLQSSMFYTSSVGHHGEKQGAQGLVDFRAWLVSPPSDAERAALGFEQFDFEPVKMSFLRKMTLQSLFPVGGLFSHNAPVNAVHYKGGSFLTALSMKHRQATATRLLKSNESHHKSTRLSDLYATPEAREETRARAVSQAAKRHGAGAESVLVTGDKTRTPVSAKRGFVMDVRFFQQP